MLRYNIYYYHSASFEPEQHSSFVSVFKTESSLNI